MSERLHTWRYLCDTCRLSGYDMGIFGTPGTEWECWAGWEGKKPFMKVAINGEQEPHEVCPHFEPMSMRNE